MTRRPRSSSLAALEPMRRVRTVPNFNHYFSFTSDLLNMLRGMPEEDWQMFWVTQFSACVQELETIVWSGLFGLGNAINNAT